MPPPEARSAALLRALSRVQSDDARLCTTPRALGSHVSAVHRAPRPLEEDGVSVKRLGERLSLDSGTLTPLLKRPRGNGPRRAPSRSRGRTHRRIHLTKHGRSLHGKAKGVPTALRMQSGRRDRCARGCEARTPAEGARGARLPAREVSLERPRRDGLRRLSAGARWLLARVQQAHRHER